MSNQVIADPRLSLAAELVRHGAHFADVGTDHAHLPLYLLEKEQIASAVASDVAKGPLDRARANIAAAGREGDVTLLLTDGLSGMDSLGLTDIAICGMGGELIASILEAAPFVRDPDIRLILQPMTRVDSLRRYLAANGFSVFSERYAVAGGRIYVCLGVAFSGIARPMDDIRAVLGDPDVRDMRDRSAYRAFLDAKEREARGRLVGKRDGGADTCAEEALLAAIAAVREEIL